MPWTHQPVFESTLARFQNSAPRMKAPARATGDQRSSGWTLWLERPVAWVEIGSDSPSGPGPISEHESLTFSTRRGSPAGAASLEGAANTRRVVGRKAERGRVYRGVIYFFPQQRLGRGSRNHHHPQFFRAGLGKLTTPLSRQMQLPNRMIAVVAHPKAVARDLADSWPDGAQRTWPGDGWLPNSASHGVRLALARRTAPPPPRMRGSRALVDGWQERSDGGAARKGGGGCGGGCGRSSDGQHKIQGNVASNGRMAKQATRERPKLKR